ncbi:hypothetical protein ACFQ7B_40135 [Streptomyces erythrochromogenes]|uniref:hypothetical protein n=1 Tax=Streptomyces erythrochromogenes TaxID=285574 RepID=UPI0036BA6A75
MPDKTNETTGFTALPSPFGLTGTVVTAGALHTQREHAKWLAEAKNAHCLMIAKGSRPNLHAAQAAKILRHRTGLKTGKVTRQTVYTITDSHDVVRGITPGHRPHRQSTTGHRSRPPHQRHNIR